MTRPAEIETGTVIEAGAKAAPETASEAGPETGPVQVDHIAARSYHARRGPIDNAFTYGADYILVDPEAPVRAPVLFGRNRPGLMALHDADHGGKPGRGVGAGWLRRMLALQGIEIPGLHFLLLTQPRVLGHVFNPVSFWFCLDGDGVLRAVLAEVTNTFGDRHSYLCVKPDLAPITRSDRLHARKIFHVSPFQEIGGRYGFRFDLAPDRVGVWIDFRQGEQGLYATLTGRRRPLDQGAILRAATRLGSRRVLALIHWQALKLVLKGARYRTRPEPPLQEVTR